MAETHLTDDQFLVLVEAHAHGEASPEQVAVLEADHRRWTTSLVHLLADTEDTLEVLRRSNDEQTYQVLTDFENEHRRLLAAYARLTGDVTVLEVDVTEAGLGHPTVALSLIHI